MHQVTLAVTDTDGATRSQTVPVRVFSATSLRLTFEAERIHLSAPAVVAKDPEASAGAYATSPKAGQGRMRCQVVLQAPGTLIVWARVKSSSETANPFSASLDSQPAVPVEAAGAAAGRWRWVQVLAGVSLEAGSHRLVVSPAAAGAGLDRLVVTDDPYFDPAWISVETP